MAWKVGTLELARTGELNGAFIVLLFLLAIAVTALVVFVERGQRRIVINYPKRQQGKRMYAGQSSFLPLKLNMAGVIPPIFASSIILFPATIAGWFSSSEGMGWLQDIATSISPGQPLYVMLYTIAIVFTMRLWPRSTNTTNAVTAIANKNNKTIKAPLSSPVLANSSVPPIADGNPETQLLAGLVVLRVWDG
jgi:preprotein translocase subunit SecY